MPYNVVDANRRAVATGTALGAQMFENSLRMQQLKSQEALRRLQEQQVAQQMAMQLWQHNQVVQQMADTAKANAAFETMTTPTLGTKQLPVQGPPTAEGPADLGTAPVEMPNPLYTPNRGEAFMRAYGPLAKTPDQAGKLLLDAATINLHDAQARFQGQARPRTPEQVEADKALAEQRKAATDLTRAKIDEIREGKGKAGADPEWVRSVKFYEERTGKKLSDAEVKDLFELRHGLKARAAVTHAKTEGDYISSHIDRAMDQMIVEDGVDKKGNPKFRAPRSRKEAVDALRKEYSTLFGGKPEVAAGGAATTAPEEEKVIVVAPNGQKGRIPKSQLERAKQAGYKEYEG